MIIDSEEGFRIRMGTFGDIDGLSDLYLRLSPSVRRLFHPFPFRPRRLKIILTGMLVGQTMIRVLRYLIPRLGFIVIVAESTGASGIEGFIYLRLIGKEKGKLIGSIGIVAREGSRARGIGKKLYSGMIDVSRSLGIMKFRSTVVDENGPSLNQCLKLGYQVLGYTEDDYWEGERIRNLILEMDLTKNWS